jgi:uncharacterized membrane protein YbhN (UPF0104 family)
LKLKPWALPFWVVFLILSWWINGEKTRALVKHKGFSLKKLRAFQLGATSSLLNYLPLQGGAAARGAYLNKHLGLPISQFFSILAGTYVIMIVVQSAMGALLCLITIQEYSLGILLILFLILLTLGLSLALFRWPEKWTKLNTRSRLRFLPIIHENFVAIFRDRKTLILLILLEIALFGTETLKIKMAFTLLGVGNQLPWIAAAIMATLTIPTVLLNITPAGLGIRESAIAFSALAFHVSLETSFLAAGLDRLLTLLITFSLGLLLAWKLLTSFLNKTHTN